MDQQTDEHQREQTQEISGQTSFDVISFQASKLPDGYRPMILSKLLRSLKYGNEYFKLIDNESYYNNYHKFIESLLKRPKAIIKIAALSDNYDVCLGWSLIEGNTLHYCYVNKEYRRQGIATALTKQTFDTITHLTHLGLQIWASKFNNNPSDKSNKPLVVFNPFA